MKIEQQWIDQDSEFIRSKIIEYNEKHIPESIKTPFERVSFVIRNDKGEIVAGITANTFWHQMHIDFLWVSEDFRKCGYGSELLKKMESYASSKGCKVIQLDTISFQAPEFYRKNGYTVIGICKEFIEGADQYYLEKRI